MFLVLGGLGALAAVISLASAPARLVGDDLTPRTAIPKEDPQDG
jgi:hypothetical protein